MRHNTPAPLRGREEIAGPTSRLRRAEMARLKAEERHRWATRAWTRAETLRQDVARRREFVRDLRDEAPSPATRDPLQP